MFSTAMVIWKRELSLKSLFSPSIHFLNSEPWSVRLHRPVCGELDQKVEIFLTIHVTSVLHSFNTETCYI